MAKRIAYIGLGSNLGDRAATLLEATTRLAQVDGVTVRKVSQFLQTEPVGGPADQPPYLNAAAEIETTLEPLPLLSALQQIEAALGRDRSAETRWGPRTCDLDLLLMGEVVLDTDELTVPHPRMHERLFVLRPLAGIAPDAVHPRLALTVAEMLADAEVAG